MPNPERSKAIAAKLETIPISYRKTYKAAVNTNSRKAAVTAFCQECVAYVRSEVTECTALDCPLWAHRPYQK